MNGMLSIYISPSHLDTGHTFAEEARQYVDFFTASEPAAGHDKVQVPGEPERRLRAERTAGGIPLPETVWHAIRQTAREVGLPDKKINDLTAPCAS
jgi:uncharacterized oxidoreductase